MATTVPHDLRNRGVARNLGERLHHIPWTVCVAACICAALLASDWLFSLLPPSGNAIRRELKAAAAELPTQPMLAPSAAVLTAMRRDFSGRDVSIATTPTWSIIAVTLYGLDREACVEAAARARRIDGRVVVMLQGYGAAEPCGSRNNMT